MDKKINHTINSHQTTYHGTGHHYLNLMSPIVFLLVILFFSAWIRFDGITEQGIFSGDSFSYLEEAKLWANGQPPKFMSHYYRPVSYFLQGMAIRIFGYNDYSIKILHGFMDMISILMIFLIASRLVKNLWVGVVSSLIYAFLPLVVRLVRWEMLHAESTFFVLLSFLFFILFDSGKNKPGAKFFLLVLSGVSLGLAANTHPDLASLALGYVIYLFIKQYNQKNIKNSLKLFFIFSSIYSISFFLPSLMGFVVFGIEKVWGMFTLTLRFTQVTSVSKYGEQSKLILIFNILYHSLVYFFSTMGFFMMLLFSGTLIIVIYRKWKKLSDPLVSYLPFFLIFAYVIVFAIFLKTFPENWGRIFMPLLPLVIFIITHWYYKISQQLFGKYALIVFIGLFLGVFLLNPKITPQKVKYFRSPYRFVYDILKDDVNSGNKLLIAPVSIDSFDKGYQCDLYFGKNAIYMIHLPIEKEYNLESLKKLLKNLDVRYIFLGNKIEYQLFNPDFPIPNLPYYLRWLRDEKISYSLEKDLEIIQAYIRGRGGLLLNKSRFGEIYSLTSEKAAPKESGLIINGSFEHWWKGFPIGEWELISGRISTSGEASHGLNSIRFEPNNKEGTRIIWNFKKPLHLYKEGAKLRVRLDAMSSESGKLAFFFTAVIDGKGQIIKPGMVKYTGKNKWTTLSEDIVIIPGAKRIIFHLWLTAEATEPAFVDNLSIELL